MYLLNKDDIRRAREMDLLTYLTYYEPVNLKHVSGNTYCTMEHDSLIINNGKWCWFSQGIGGKSALDYLIKVKGIPFREAVERILGRINEPIPLAKPKVEPIKTFSMPEVSDDPSQAYYYLIGRGISPEVAHWCIKQKLVFETTKYSNVLFVGYDLAGKPKYGFVRSITGNYKGDVSGSDKRYSFRITRAERPRKVHVFECAIDLLSYATCVQLRGGNWRKETYLSLGGIGGKSMPLALGQFLKDYPDISHVYLHLDNDQPGRNATKNITQILRPNYVVKDVPPPEGKDFNNYLRLRLSKQKSINKEASR